MVAYAAVQYSGIIRNCDLL